MSATEQPRDFSDLYTMLQNKTRAQTSVTAGTNQAKREINVGLHDMHIGFEHKLPWAEREAELITQPEYTTGTLTATEGSTTITGSGTLWDTANSFGANNMRVGGKIVIAGGKEVYTITAVASDTSATLSSRYIKDTASGASYVYFEDEYALDADFLRPVTPLGSFDINNTIELIGRNEFRRWYPRNRTTGKPMRATIVDKDFSGNTTPVRKVRFWKPPDAVYLITYPFITNKLALTTGGVAQESLTNDTDEPIVPYRYRHAIVWYALSNFYRDRHDDTRAQQALAQYTDLMLRVSGDQEIGRSLPRLKPRVSHYKGRARTPYRSGRGGRFTTGPRFDEIR